MERFILQPADRKEAEKAMALIDEAKEFLKSQGIDQWQTGYPDMETIIGDRRMGGDILSGRVLALRHTSALILRARRPMKRCRAAGKAIFPMR